MELCGFVLNIISGEYPFLDTWVENETSGWYLVSLWLYLYINVAPVPNPGPVTIF